MAIRRRSFTPRLAFLRSPLPQTAGEWAQVLQLQRQFHQAQLSKWQQILQSSVTLLDQVGVRVCARVTVCVGRYDHRTADRVRDYLTEI